MVWKIIISITIMFLFSHLGLAQNKKANPSSPYKNSQTALKNATKAKMPKGTISFSVNSQKYNADQHTVQNMFVGMGTSSMAQGMISGRGKNFSVSAVMMVPPQKGVLKSKKVASMIGMVVIIDGVEYNSGFSEGLTISIDQISEDGNNHYIGGTFSGFFAAKDGRNFQISDGKFQSDYVK